MKTYYIEMESGEVQKFSGMLGKIKAFRAARRLGAVRSDFSFYVIDSRWPDMRREIC